MPLERQWEQHRVSGLTVAPGTYDISQKISALGWGAAFGQPANTLVMLSGTLLICVVCQLLTLYAITVIEVLHSEQKQVFRSELASTASGS